MDDKTKEHIEDLYKLVKSQSRLIETQKRELINNDAHIESLKSKLATKFNNTRYIKLFQQMELAQLKHLDRIDELERELAARRQLTTITIYP